VWPRDACHGQDLRGDRFRLFFACGSKVLYDSRFSFFRSQSEKKKNNKKIKYRFAAGYNGIGYATV